MDDEVYRQLAERLEAGRPGALATVVSTRGSTPQRPGAKAVFTPEGGVLGTIGGGCLENEARLRALDALRDGRPVLLDVDLTHDYDQDTGLICGGIARIFIEVPTPAQAALYRAVGSLREERVAGALLTVVDGPRLGAHALAAADGRREGEPELLAVTADALAARQPGWRDLPDGAAYVDLVVPRERLWIAGAGHVGRAVARHASTADFEVFVIDDRPDLNHSENIPWADHHLVGEIEATLAAREYGPEDYVVVVTRGHQHDADALRAVVRSGAKYLGLIGSRRKIKLIREGLVEAGDADPADLDRVFAPIGLDIGAVSVDEIAICIAAELIAVRHGLVSTPADRAERVRRARSGSCLGGVDG